MCTISVLCVSCGDFVKWFFVWFRHLANISSSSRLIVLFIYPLYLFAIYLAHFTHYTHALGSLFWGGGGDSRIRKIHNQLLCVFVLCRVNSSD